MPAAAITSTATGGTLSSSAFKMFHLATWEIPQSAHDASRRPVNDDGHLQLEPARPSTTPAQPHAPLQHDQAFRPSNLIIASAAGADEAGFWPVTSRPSTSTWEAQSSPRRNCPPRWTRRD